MDLLKHLKKLEHRLERLMDPATEAALAPGAEPEPPPRKDSPAPAAAPLERTPLELRKSIVRAVEAQIVRLDGHPAFPFTRIDVDVVVQDAHHRALLMAELIDGKRLQRALDALLLSARIDPHPHFELFVHLLPEHQVKSRALLASGYRVECTREEATAKIQSRVRTGPRLRVLAGDAQPLELSLTQVRVNIGRLSEVSDARGRVVRRNDLAFGEGDELNQSVSRVHAHVSFDVDQQLYRLFDDNSAEGTSLVREGRTIKVPGGSRRGVALQSGDEIFVGRARLRFEG